MCIYVKKRARQRERERENYVYIYIHLTTYFSAWMHLSVLDYEGMQIYNIITKVHRSAG